MLSLHRKSGEVQQPSSFKHDVAYYAHIIRYYDPERYENYRNADFFLPPDDPGFSQMRRFQYVDPLSAVLADRANELLKYLIYSRESDPLIEKVHELNGYYKKNDEIGIVDFFWRNAKEGGRNSDIAAEIAIANMAHEQNLVDALGWLADRDDAGQYTAIAGFTNISMLFALDENHDDLARIAEKLLARKNLFVDYALAAIPLETLPAVATELAKSPDDNVKMELLMRGNSSPAVMKILRESPGIRNMLGGAIRK